MRFKVACGLLLLAGCASPAWIEGRSGPVAVYLAKTPEAVQQACEKVLGPTPGGWRGCIRFGSLRVWIWCQEKDVECLAHEIRHLIEGDFHE